MKFMNISNTHIVQSFTPKYILNLKVVSYLLIPKIFNKFKFSTHFHSDKVQCPQQRCAVSGRDRWVLPN